MMKQLHKNLRALRKFRGLKQKAMADRLKLSDHAYANIETGKTDIQLSRLEEIAQILGVEVVDLFKSDQDSLLRSAVSSSHIASHNHAANYVHQINSLCTTLPSLEQELATIRGVLEEKNKENAYLKEMIKWMKQKV